MSQQQAANFEPRQNFAKALLNQIYDVKFSKHTTLVVVLLSMIYTVYRTQHYLSTAFGLHSFIAWPTSGFIELLVLASAAITFGALRHAYIAELKDIDVRRARIGVWLAFTALGGAFLALLFVALGDAWALTHQVIPTLIMTLTQVTQMLFIIGFICAADLDEREKLRGDYRDYQAQQAQQQANECPHCHKQVSPNNRARHLAICPMRPIEA